MTSKTSLRQSTILIIDDEKIILDLTSIILKNRGFNVLTALDAISGMELARSARPDVILLDYMIPGIDGLTALKVMRREMPDSYVVMFTGKGSEEIAVELMKTGASDYVLKPFNNQDLVERIENVLKIRSVEISNRELRKEREQLLEEIAAWNRELEQRVHEKNAALERAQAEIVQAEKLSALGYLSAGMAHEIRNPLNSIALFVQLLKSGKEDREKLEYFEKIFGEIDRIDVIMSKLQEASNRTKFALSEVAIDQLLDATIETFRPQSELRGIEFKRDYLKVPPPIMADPIEIEQIFTNLFLNAIHEMPEQGTLTIQLDYDDNELKVRVTDTGRGIPQEHLSHIFDPFFSTKSAGLGMGLAVVRRIVNNYRGRIEVEKSDESGTTFCVSMPLSIIYSII